MVVAPPPPPPVALKPVEPPVEMPLEKPPEPVVVSPPPEPAPVEEPPPAAAIEKPKAVATGTLVIDAVPYAQYFVNDKLKDAEVVGTRKFALKPGEYVIKLVHPKRTYTEHVTITPNHATKLPAFRPLEPAP